MCRVVWWECFCEKFLSNFLPFYSSLSFWERHKATDTVESLTHFLALYNPLHPPPSPSTIEKILGVLLWKTQEKGEFERGSHTKIRLAMDQSFDLGQKILPVTIDVQPEAQQKNCTGHVNYFSRGNILQVKRKDPFQGNFKF